MIVYYNGEYLDDYNVKISPFDRGFQYADGVYEVLRTYNGKFFCCEDHIERLKASLKAIRIKEVPELTDLERIFYSLIEKNSYTDEVSIYIQITRGNAFPRTHFFPKTEVRPTVIVVVSPIASPDPEGIKVILTDDIRWSRCDIKSISLLPNVLANQEAADNDAEEAIWVRDGYLTEGTHTNFFGIKNETVITYPLSNFILPGVSRKVVLGLCNDLGVPAQEKGIEKNSIRDYDEFFITGTTVEVTPVVQMDEWTVGNGKPGRVTKMIQDAFHELVRKW